MNILLGDSVVDQDRRIGIVENRSGSQLTIRYPGQGNIRERRHRSEVSPLAQLMYAARTTGKPLQIGRAISLTGDSTLSELVSLFGYSTGQMRTDSLSRVLRQLERANLEIETTSNAWGRDERFRLTALTAQGESQDGHANGVPTDDEGRSTQADPEAMTVRVEIPDPFWPTALGLPRVRELEFLRALTLNDPILCLLYLPEEAAGQSGLQGTWEGMIGWAYRSAQRFLWGHEFGSESCKVQVGSAGLIHSYLRPTVLDASAPHLLDSPRGLNLITIKRASEQPNDFDRFTALWPGPIFEFKPDLGPYGMPAEDLKAINNCLRIASGHPTTTEPGDLPLRVLLWARRNHAQLMSKAVTSWGPLVASKGIRSFKGSNEGATTLSLKAHVACWIREIDRGAELRFEEVKDDHEGDDDPGMPDIRQRADLAVEGHGLFEIESMIGSGPMESFYQRKVFARIKGDSGTPFWLCVPNETILWAGPFLADLALHLADGGRVVLPSADGTLLQVEAKELATSGLEELDAKPANRGETPDPAVAETPITLADVAGYGEVRKQIGELIIWPERHRSLLRGISKSSGILFFGPPGCGKSRWARAIAGELEQEVRLLAPSDLRGPYLGWGQIMIREQFGWLAEKGSRMLVIDEIDAVARSRRERQMHTDEMASVNELLVQIDKALRLGRLIVGTTNFIGSLDEALTRSGRFGRFIPIGPPDTGEAAKILIYYLNLLSSHAGDDGRLSVRVPTEQAIVDMVAPMIEENRRLGRFLCGADLEEAVNRAYLRCARRAFPDGGWAREADNLDIVLTEEELRRSLEEVPRSVHRESAEPFLDDVKLYCGMRSADYFKDLLLS
jgi:hypothetical protein